MVASRHKKSALMTSLHHCEGEGEREEKEMKRKSFEQKKIPGLT